MLVILYNALLGSEVNIALEIKFYICYICFDMLFPLWV